MGEVINLRRARKARGRQAAEQAAAEARARHGRTRAQRDAEQAEAERTRRTIDQARREPSGAADAPDSSGAGDEIQSV